MNISHETIQAVRDELEPVFGGFHRLMPRRIQNVLLVSSLYESFIIEEDGLVNELLISEYMNMNLTHAPKLTSVATGKEALDYIESNPVDLVITMTRLGSWPVGAFARQVKQIRNDLPVVVLAGEHTELFKQGELHHLEGIDRAFVWNGDTKILIAIIKLIEDSFNVEHDTRLGDVRVILLVENSIRFYSAFLPIIYTELVKLTQSLMAEGVNLMHRLLRMRARPKILLAETYEQAWSIYEKYQANILGVISDIRFPREGKLDADAGIDFARRIKEDVRALPILLQSSDVALEGQAMAIGAAFANKRSPNLLHEVRDFLLGSLGFGDFVFRLPSGQEVGRACDLRSFEEAVRNIPIESLEYHARRDHFSNWLMARTEFALASQIKPKRVSDFSNLEAVRQYLLEMLMQTREENREQAVADFQPKQFDVGTTFSRLGGGSMGGKGRGLAFIRALVRRHQLTNRFDGVQLYVPRSTAIGTDAFDEFIDRNNLREYVTSEKHDDEIMHAFLQAKLPSQLHTDLKVFLREVRYPLAVRSSSLLEDSLDRPFAGIYSTYMIPNNHPDLKIRLRQLSAAIKLVYASAFLRSARRYLEATGHHSEEEKMAVVLQEIVGSAHGPRFYPTFSGVARSYNFYPTYHASPDDGVVCVALGLGKTVVEGGEYLMFSPAHPEVLPQFPSTQAWLQDSQRRFYAMDISRSRAFPKTDPDANLLRCNLEDAEQDGTLAMLGSVYSPENDRIYDGIFREGPRIVTFAHILKHQELRLADIVDTLLEVGEQAMACPIEIEFAVELEPKPARFAILQIRPIISDAEYEAVAVEQAEIDRAFCYSDQALGNGRMDSICDIIYVKPESFDSSHTREIAAEIGACNEALRQSSRQSVIIGPGRWGSSDRWLGIPVTWDQISTARVIVETTAPDFVIKPSQGTHFFQNLTSMRVGYFTVNPLAGKGHIDWDWLSCQPGVHETRYIRHVQLNKPLLIKLDGRCRNGVMLKP